MVTQYGLAIYIENADDAWRHAALVSCETEDRGQIAEGFKEEARALFERAINRGIVRPWRPGKIVLEVIER